jgi:hypothetical protein
MSFIYINSWGITVGCGKIRKNDQKDVVNATSKVLKKEKRNLKKLNTGVIYSFRNKLECLSLNTRLGWKGLPGTNTLASYGNRNLRP